MTLCERGLYIEGMVSQTADLNLSSLLSHAPGADVEVMAEGSLMPDEELLADFGVDLLEPLAWEVTVRSTGGDDDYIVEGQVEGVAEIECRRCLTSTPAEAMGSFVLQMAYDPSQEHDLTLLETEDEDDLLVFSQPTVDFAPFLVQLFALELPLTVLCKESCKGLSLDGVNLNEFPDHQAPGPEAEEASPFAVLKDLDL